MAFESLSYRCNIPLEGFPARWLPLVHPYDPDLPLFPIYYFHSLPLGLASDHRPGQTERVFGYMERLNLSDDGHVSATVVTNKDLNNSQNASYAQAAVKAVQERLGLNDPVTKVDVINCFLPPLDHANAVLGEIWERVVSEAYGGKLPFGRLWDEVFGLARFVASFNSQSGRKGELIQTHYFASRFGERIQAGGGIPQVDFFLFPTIQELRDVGNPLANFPKFATLAELTVEFRRLFCDDLPIDGLKFSRFKNPAGGKFNTTSFFGLVDQLNWSLRPALTECFNAFGKGPPRTLVFLMMLHDLRFGQIDHAQISSAQSGSIYNGMKGSYQSPKVIQIYSQQCFGNANAMPIDTWVETFLQWPLVAWPTGSNPHKSLFVQSKNLGKVERLIWVAAQARKVHSSACDNALWCLKKSSGDEEADSVARGANPLACNICLPAIRNVCPAYNRIKNATVCFNRAQQPGELFSIQTSTNNNTTPNQTFTVCRGKSIYGDVVDDFSPKDDPEGFAPFPDPSHGGTDISVDEFVRFY